MAKGKKKGGSNAAPAADDADDFEVIEKAELEEETGGKAKAGKKGRKAKKEAELEEAQRELEALNDGEDEPEPEPAPKPNKKAGKKAKAKAAKEASEDEDEDDEEVETAKPKVGLSCQQISTKIIHTMYLHLKMVISFLRFFSFVFSQKMQEQKYLNHRNWHQIDTGFNFLPDLLAKSLNFT